MSRQLEQPWRAIDAARELAKRNGNARIEVTDLRDGSTVPVGAATT